MFKLQRGSNGSLRGEAADGDASVREASSSSTAGTLGQDAALGANVVAKEDAVPKIHPLEASRHNAQDTSSDVHGAADDESASAMAIHGAPSARPSTEMLDGDGNDDDEGRNALSTSPTKRGSRLGATLHKLHFRASSSSAHRPAGVTQSEYGGEDAESSGDAQRRAAKAASPRKSNSGKHTPVTSQDATGDFAQFLQAEELKDALAREQEEEVNRDLKAAKAARKHRDAAGHYAGHGLGGKGKPESPEERWQRAHRNDQKDSGFVPGLPTLEQRGYFPGDLRHHGHLEVKKKPKVRPVLAQNNSEGSTKEADIRRLRPPGLCGPVSDSSDEQEGSSEAEDEDKRTQRRARGVDSSASSVISGSSTIAEPHDETTAGQDINPSVMSLKSYDSEQTTHSSLLSGGANPKLAKPLLELEELELDSFLKNFGRHTREIRVGHSANFPRRRMPRWEDFKVPPGEAALAAAQGKRVTVLTHVDRGLRVLEEREGEGGPRPRSANRDTTKRGKRSIDKKRLMSEKLASASNSDAEDANPAKSKAAASILGSGPNDKHSLPATSTPSSPQQQRVSWAPSVGKDIERGKEAIKSNLKSAGPSSPSFGLRRSDMEKDEKTAKQQERDAHLTDLPVAGWIHSKDAVYNIHDDDIEYRPTVDEARLDDDEWEILHAPVEGEGDVPIDEDSQVDGVAWAIAYILATIERYAPEELDNSPDQKYRESKTRSHIERLYLIAPFWERLLFGIRRVYRWDNPRRTSSFMMSYFVLWYMNLLATAFMLILMFYICQFRFFPPSASFLHEQVRARMARGVDADRLAERLRRRSRLDVLELYKRFVAAYGSAAQLGCGDVADFHEKVKNLILWRDVRATWRTLTVMGIATVFVTFAPTAVICKTITGFLGFTFFILLPLQSHYPRFRRPLSPVWWLLWGAPTDQQFAIQLLRRRHLERQRLKHPPNAASNLKGAAAKETGFSTGDTSLTPEQKGSLQGSTSAAGLKNRFLQRSSAASAVAFGALRPFRSGTEGSGASAGEKLLDLQTIKVLKDGEVESRPRKLGSFFCQHHGVPGHLHVTTRMLYFVALHTYATPGHGKSGHKTCKTLLQDISGLVKTKSIKLLVWNSSGLQILRRHKQSLFFSNMPHRDNAFNLLLAIGSEVWHEHD